MRPTWAEISLSALRHNYRTIHQHVAPDTTVCAVVKADAYGHGSVPCARALEAEGATWFAVSSVDEGIALRKGGVRGRVLMLSGFWRGDEDEILRNDLTPAVWENWQVALLEQAAERLHRDEARIPVHLKVNTGMNRVGIDVKNLPGFLEILCQTKHILVEGVFSHFASSEIIDAPDVERQLKAYNEALGMVEAKGLEPIYCHIGNSAAIVTRRDAWKDMVRPGLALYGYSLPITSTTSDIPDHSLDLPLKPVLSWKTRITWLHHVEAGQAVGYNGKYVTTRPTVIAVLPVGYADGVSRHLSSRGRVIVRDHYAPIIGNISMDITLVDVTDVPGVSGGDEVALIGASEHCCVDAWELANYSTTIPYEVLCNISKRVPRKYIE